MLNHQIQSMKESTDTVRFVLTATICFATAEGLKIECIHDHERGQLMHLSDNSFQASQ